ncbi:MAG: hypothetical protein GF350_05120 [Chitinivibrionales bacterium]|nr:hypothetical protein [Chitinivibrionales bacterium]
MAHRARLGDYADAASLLNTALQKIQAFLRNPGISEKTMQKCMFSLETMYMMQKQDDWIALADVIEYEFVPILKSLIHSGTISAT